MNAIIRSRSIGLILMAASILALVMSIYASHQTSQYARCQSQVSERLIEANTARARAAEEDRQSDREESEATALLIRAVFTGTSTTERLAAYDEYQRTLGAIEERRKATAAERAAHPIPEPPSQACA